MVNNMEALCTVSPMRDRDVRVMLHDRLRAQHADEPDTRYVDELDLCGSVRVDVAVVNGALTGYEIKSPRDNLRRLPSQIETYSKVLDYASLVVAERHYAAAQPLLPDWWGVLVLEDSAEVPSLAVEKPGTANPCVDALSIVQLLWRDEALHELEIRGLAVGLRSKPRRLVWQRLCDAVSLSELQDIVRSRLKARQGWRSAPR